jgi:hypothetical protein
MDSHIGSQRSFMSLSAHSSYFENLGEPTLVNVRVILLVEDNKTDEYIHPHTELETLRARVVYMGMDNTVILFPVQHNDMQTKVRKDRT